MHRWMRGHRKHQFVLYSDYKVSIVRLLTALGEFNGHRPRYSAKVVFEQWKRVQSGKHALVRTLPNEWTAFIQSYLINVSIPLTLFAQQVVSVDFRSKIFYICECVRKS